MHLNTPRMCNYLAMNNLKFRFEGKAAHAASAAELGRSALDAVELMNTGVEYMREHISDQARVHYSIPEGGEAPNVVPSEAIVWYYVRAPEREEVESITDWVREIAEGAAKMTQTQVEEDFLTGTYNMLPNETISELIYENMEELGPIKYTAEEKEQAKNLREPIGEKKVKVQMATAPERVLEDSLYPKPLEPFDKDGLLEVSWDVCDVSFIAPLGQFQTATWAIGTPPIVGKQ